MSSYWMLPQPPCRVEYVDANGDLRQTPTYPSYKLASIQAAILQGQGAQIRAIFRDAGSNWTPGTANQITPPGWLRRLGA